MGMWFRSQVSSMRSFLTRAPRSAVHCLQRYGGIGRVKQTVQR